MGIMSIVGFFFLGVAALVSDAYGPAALRSIRVVAEEEHLAFHAGGCAERHPCCCPGYW